MIFKIIKNPIFFGIIVGLIMVLLTYINNKVSKERENSYIVYIKIFISSSIVSGSLKYLYDEYLPKMKELIGGNKKIELNPPNINKSFDKPNNGHSDVYTDMPNW